ncbi:MAG: sirohydrochlorin cobaltochelatase [Bacillota bacterium]|nr:sirohydrochlorin cobaltochelatase [Bacillota bacterium]
MNAKAAPLPSNPLNISAACPTRLQGASRKSILVTSFGSSYNENRRLTLDAIEAAVAGRYPDWSVRRAYTSQAVIDILKERDGIRIDNIREAMERLLTDGVRELIVQPTLVMPGSQYEDLAEAVAPYADRFDVFALGKPLIYHNEDYDAVVDALAAAIPEFGLDDTAVLLKGHGSHHYANAIFAALDYVLHARGYKNVFVGTVKGFPNIKQVMARVSAFGAKKLLLYPFMMVAGAHAAKDMAGPGEDSWASLLTRAGFQVENRLIGLAQHQGIIDIILAHLDSSMKEVGL